MSREGRGAWPMTMTSTGRRGAYRHGTQSRRASRARLLDAVRLGQPALLHAGHHIPVRAFFRPTSSSAIRRTARRSGAMRWRRPRCIVAVGSPMLGAMADARGRLKRYDGLAVGRLRAGQAALWYAVPGAAQGYIALIVLAGLLVATCRRRIHHRAQQFADAAPRPARTSSDASAAAAGRWAMSAG